MEPLGNSLSRVLEGVQVDPSRGWINDPDGVCQMCGGAGFLVSHRWEQGKPQKLVPCECNRDKLEQLAINRMIGGSGLEKNRDIVFEAFPHARPGQKDAWEAANAFAEDPRGWLIFRGPWGSGRTTIAMCIGNARINLARPCLYRVVPNLLDELHWTFNDDKQPGLRERYEKVLNTPLLILDDLGAEAQTRSSGQRLFQILNHRWDQRLPTIITTNLGDDEIEPRLRARLSDRTRCRLVDVRPPRKP